VHFSVVTLEMGVSRTICPGWLWSVILLSSASQVARITGVSHQSPTWPGICCIAQSDLKFMIFLPQPAEFWDYGRCIPQCQHQMWCP
jgi:hypothetical protein